MSEWCQIESSFLTVQITSKGAEMKRLFSRAWNQELLWSGEDKIWERSAPVLFPIVGKLINDEYIFQNKKYTLPRHGFAREMEFTCTKADVHECEFTLNANHATLACYPFVFELKVHYLINGANLQIQYTVKNKDKQDMYFSLGAHPGFETKNISDYELIFEKAEDFYYLTNNELLDESQKVVLKEKRLSLTPELFTKDALIVRKPRSKYIDLVNKTTRYAIRISSKQVPYLGIWGRGSMPFICLEPWHGVADHIHHDQQLETKEGIIKLPQGSEFSFSYSIEALLS
jgi:galactose mutarotase-like enzyme